MSIVTPVRISYDVQEDSSPTRGDWSDFRRFLDADFDHYEDEPPQLDDALYLDPEDIAWLIRDGDGGFNPAESGPCDLELLTLSASEWHHDETDEPFDGHPHDAFQGEVA